MTNEEIETVRGLGLRLIEAEFEHFSKDNTDNSEYVAAIRRIADTAFAFLKTGTASDPIRVSVREELIERAREIFIQDWMKPLEDDEELPDADEAADTFDYLLGE